MTYEQIVYKLRQFQAVEIHWGNHEINILLNKGFIYVESLPAVPLLVFHNLSTALSQWRYPELMLSLGEIMDMVEEKDVCSNSVFREIALLDPNLLVEPTNLLRDSITYGIICQDSSPEHNIQCEVESISSCLYNVTLETKIDQTLEWRWLKEMLDRKRILLKNPLTYHDVWESFMFHKYVWEDGADESQGQLAGADKNFYCSCWSACEESEGMWNNHVRGTLSKQDHSKRDESEDSPMVKIETTVGHLLLSLGLSKICLTQNIWNSFRAGRVGYFDEFDLRTFKEKSFSMIETQKDFRLSYRFPHLIMQSFFMKCKQFEYEQEVRLVLKDNYELKALQRDEFGVYFQTDPRRWIHEIVVHPDCVENDYKDILKQLSMHGIDTVVMSPLSSCMMRSE